MKQTAPPQSVGTWHVQLLGAIRLSSPDAGGEAVTRFRTAKVALLLAKLALEPRRAHGREELAAILSPDAPDAATGRAHLSQTLTYLRQVLEPEGVPRGSILRADPNHVGIVPGALSCDAAKFEASLGAADRAPDGLSLTLLRDACALYTGELLPGFFGDWAADERSRLAALFEEARERLRKREAALPVPAPSVVRLPHPLTSYFGREAEQAQVLSWLSAEDGPRLVTLTGSGGIGKTRLAMEAAHAIAARAGTYRDAVFVPLAEVTHADHVARAVADALGLRDDERDPLAQLVAFLRARDRHGQRTLLILDNLEQLEDTTAPFVREILQCAPAAAVLATSRYRVGVPGEQEFPLLPLPGAGGPFHENAHARTSAATPGELSPLTDVRLFVERARLVRPGFAVTEANAGAVADLCRLLEGMPLAIELAAAWARLLSPAQIAERLGRRFDLLVRRDKNDESGYGGRRHHSLWAAIAWSYDLLPPSLQRFFAALSVFRGGFSLEAAQTLTGVADAIEPLTLLIERSLVLADPDDAGTMRYRLLESLREFGDGQLSHDHRHELRERHARYYRQQARENTVQADRHFQSLRRGYTDMEEAVRFAVESGDGETALEIATYLWHRVDRFDPISYKITRLTEVVERCEMLAPPPSARINALIAIGELASMQGKLDTAREMSEAAYALALQSGDEDGRSLAAFNLARILFQSGDYEGTRRCFEAELAASVGKDEKHAVRLLNGLAVVASNMGEYDRADELYRQTAERGRRVGAAILGGALSNWAHIRLFRGDFAGAAPLLAEAREWAQSRNHLSMLALINNVEAMGAILQNDRWRALELGADSMRMFREIGEEQRLVETIGLIGRAVGAQSTDYAAESARLIGAGSALRAASNTELNKLDQAQEDEAVAAAKTMLGEIVFREAWQQGAGMTLEQAVGHAEQAAAAHRL